MSFRLFRLLGFLSLGSSFVAAGPEKVRINDDSPVASRIPCSEFDRAVLYRSEEGWLRQLKLQGRYHGQWEHLDARGTSRYTDFQRWEHRRFRTGLRADFRGDWSLGYHFNHANGLAFANRDFVSNLEDLILEWKPGSEAHGVELSNEIALFYFRAGKFKNNITIEETISSNSIKTLERSHFVNSTHASRPWGIELGFRIGSVRNYLGVSSNAFDFDPDENEQFNWGRYDHGAIATYRLETDLTEEIELHIDYMHTDISSYPDILAAGDGIAGGSAEHFAALGVQVNSGKLDLLSELMFASNFSPPPLGAGALQSERGGGMPLLSLSCPPTSSRTESSWWDAIISRNTPTTRTRRTIPDPCPVSGITMPTG